VEGDAVLRGQQLAGSRARRICERLAGTKLTGKTLEARVRVADTDPSLDHETKCAWLAEESAKRGHSISRRLADRIITAAHKARTVSYWSPRRSDLDVILCHYNPAGWKTPPRLFFEVCESLVSSGVEPLVLQVVRQNQSPAPTPPGVRAEAMQSDSVLFLKENLWNLAAGMTSRPKMLFLDADVFFSRRDIFDATSEALDECDVIQPFSAAAWLSKDNAIELVREPSAMAIRQGEQPLLGRFHPGFAWAMTKEFFARCGGFYDRHPLGGGDAAWVFAMTPGVPRLPKSENHAFAETPSYRAYREQMLSLKPTVGTLRGTVYHKWHGSRDNRKYEERYRFMPQMVAGEYPLDRRPDGLLVWRDENYSHAALRYFQGRMEDG
jgi:hypothetical protein